MSLSRRYLLDIIDEYQSKNFVDKCNYLKNRILEITNWDKWSNQIKHNLSHFTSKLKTKWDNCLRKKDKFFSIHNTWLNGIIHFPIHSSYLKKKKSGRPSISFINSSERFKGKKTEKLRSENRTWELSYATQMSFCLLGQNNVENVVNNLTQTTPTWALKYKNAF
jgi:hypothetical protein